MPGALVRFVPGEHAPLTALAEYYEVPWNNSNASVQGFAPRGMDVDSKGVVWTVLSSGHLASFDRSKCRGKLNGPAAKGQHCAEGWTLYQLPGPNYKGAQDSGSSGQRKSARFFSNHAVCSCCATVGRGAGPIIWRGQSSAARGR